MSDDNAYPPPDSPLWVPAADYWLFWAWLIMFNDKPDGHLISHTVRPRLRRGKEGAGAIGGPRALAPAGPAVAP